MKKQIHVDTNHFSMPHALFEKRTIEGMSQFWPPKNHCQIFGKMLE